MKQRLTNIIRCQSGVAHLFLLLALIVSLVIGSAGYAYNRVSNASTASKTNVNVATYNIRSQRWDKNRSTVPGKETWAVRKSRVEAVISKEQPGIIGMQEVIAINPDTGQYVSQRNDMFGFMYSKGYVCYAGSGDNSSPICWKRANFELLSANGIPSTNEIKIYDAGSSKKKDAPATRYLTIVRLRQKHDNKIAVVFNYHLNHHEQVDNQLGSLAKNIKSIHKALAGDHIFFTGDFNKKHSNVISRLKGAGVRLKIADNHKGIDHVLVTSSTQIRGTVVSQGKPLASDHPMVMAKLTF